ncbi:hypothetical protein BGZ76_006899, partial [Entomortierella beljakovae]
MGTLRDQGNRMGQNQAYHAYQMNHAYQVEHALEQRPYHFGNQINGSPQSYYPVLQGPMYSMRDAEPVLTSTPRSSYR